jgi:NADPH:quinone reductase
MKPAAGPGRTMRALRYDPDAPDGLRIGDVTEPEPGPDEALVSIQAVSLNFGEVASLAARCRPGEVAGWDAAGVVVRPAADGSGPAAGTRVVTFSWMGGWAQRRAVPTTEMAIVPDHVDLGAASALPVAGVTALRALRALGPVQGRRVLVTGASGGVGRFAVQLAAQAGAQVVASVGSPARAAGLADLGAAEIVVGVENLSAPVYGVLDAVGGPQLADALTHVEDAGVVQWYGRASGQPLQLGAAHRDGRRWRLEAFELQTPLGSDLDYLVQLVAAKKIDPQIGWRGSWNQAGEAVRALLARRVAGKAILDVENAISG